MVNFVGTEILLFNWPYNWCTDQLSPCWLERETKVCELLGYGY